MCPNSIIYNGLEVIPVWVVWGQSIYYLGTWTLQNMELGTTVLVLWLAYSIRADLGLHT